MTIHDETRSFHLDHAASLTYVTEKVPWLFNYNFFAVIYCLCADEFSGGKGQSLHDASD